MTQFLLLLQCFASNYYFFQDFHVCLQSPFAPACYLLIHQSPSLIDLINNSTLNAQYYNFSIFAMFGSSAVSSDFFLVGGQCFIFFFICLSLCLISIYFLISIHDLPGKRNCCKHTFSNGVLRSWERGSILQFFDQVSVCW